LSKRRRNLHRLHDAGLSGQVHALHESAAWVVAFIQRSDDLRQGDSCASQVYTGVAQSRTLLAQAGSQGRSRAGVIAPACTVAANRGAGSRPGFRSLSGRPPRGRRLASGEWHTRNRCLSYLPGGGRDEFGFRHPRG
jgi:hypothetical protein